jgi:hypothetical protein
MVLENWIHTCRRLKLDPCLSLYKNHCKIHQRPQCKTGNFQTTTGKTLEYIAIGNNFLNGTPIAQEIIDKLDYIKLKSFCPEKGIITREKRQPTEREKIFDSYSLDRS